MVTPFPYIPSAGPLPVDEKADVRETLPDFAQGPEETAPVREAIVSLIAQTQLEWQYNSGYAAAQGDPTRATDEYLDGLGEDRDYKRLPNESNTDYRERIFGAQQIVSPKKIIDVVNNILSPFTNIQAQIFESVLDQLFINDGSVPTNYHAFITDAEVGLPIDPFYPDRYYEEKGYASPGGAWVFSNEGRFFIIRVPQITDIQNEAAFIYDTSETPDVSSEYLFVGDGSNDFFSEQNGYIGAFTQSLTTTPQNIYDSIVSAVNAIKGHGIRWELMVDPTLNNFANL